MIHYLRISVLAISFIVFSGFLNATPTPENNKSDIPREKNTHVDDKKIYFDIGDIYDSIRRSGKLRIGISRFYPPLNNTRKENGVLVHYGAEIKMGESLADFLGVKPEFIPLDVPDYIPAITNRKVDVVIGGFSRNLERGKTIWFSQPYLSITPGALADSRIIPQTRFGEEFEEEPFRTIWDLNRLADLNFAVKKGSAYESLIREKFPRHTVILYNANEEGLQLLMSNKAHVFVHDSLFLKYIYDTTPEWKSRYFFLQGGAYREELSVGLPMGDLILKQSVDFWIQEILRTEKLEEWMRDE